MNLLSSLFLFGLFFFLKGCFDRCENKTERIVFVLAVLLKIVGAFGVGFLYSSYYSGGDTFNYLHDLELLDSQSTDGFFFCEQPRAWFFVRLLYPIYQLSFSNYWVLAVNLSVMSFAATWFFYQELQRLGIKRWPARLALFFIPSVVFWTSGLMKETIAYAIINLIFVILLRVYRKATFLGAHLLEFVLLLVVLFYLKYYLFAPLLLVSILFFVGHFTKGFLSITQLVWTLSGVAFFVSITVSLLHPNMNFSFFLEALFNNYTRTLQHSSPEAIIPLSYDGSLLSFIANMPIALFTGFFRPLVFESWNWFSFLLSIENLCILILFGWFLLSTVKVPQFKNQMFLLLSVGFIVFLGIVLPIASPNYGSLVRYRVAYYPLFVLLVLQNFEYKKRV